MSETLPPLPEPHHRLYTNSQGFVRTHFEYESEKFLADAKAACMWPSGHRLRDSFTTDQMRYYAAEALAQRKPLTHEQISDLIPFTDRQHNNSLFPCWSIVDMVWFARAIERAHGITKDKP